MFSCIAMADDDDSMETSILVNQAEFSGSDVAERAHLGWCTRQGRGVHVVEAPWQRFKPMFFAGVGILSLGVGMATLRTSFHKNETAEPLAAMRSLQQPAFECHAEAASWSIAWSLQKKAWCCQHTGRGCEITGKVESANAQSTDVEVAAPRDLQGGIGIAVAAKSLQKKGPWCYLTRGQACGSSSAPLTVAAAFALLVMALAAICGIVGWKRSKGQKESLNSLPRAEKLTTSSLPPLQPLPVAGLGKSVKDKPIRSCRMCS